MTQNKFQIRFFVIIVSLMILITFTMGGIFKKASAEEKILKIGLLTDLNNPLGRDYQRLLEALVPVYAQKGGLAIGDEKYNIKLIVYDSKSNAETARAAVERLVYQDRVKFILGDVTADAWAPVTEENKVLSVVYTPSLAMLSPELKYMFQGSMLNTSVPVIWSWFVNYYPKLKTIGAMFTDNLHGHGDAKQMEQICHMLDLDLVTTIFYPPDTTDFSAYATKMKTSNPQVYTCAGGGPVQDCLSLKAIREAGYKGLFFSYRGLAPGQVEKIVPLDLFVGSSFVVPDIEVDPPTLSVSREAKDAYVAKYGAWDSPSSAFATSWYLLKTAFEKSGSIDPNKVGAVISNGLRFETFQAPAMMISRPDQKNYRTIDALYGCYIGTIENGKLKVFNTISPDEGFEYIKKSKVFGVYK